MFRIYAGDDLVYEPGDYSLALLQPNLTLEMGKAGSLKFTVIPGHPFENRLKEITKPISVKQDDVTIFRGRILSYSRSFNNQWEIYCEGDLSYLLDSVQKTVKYDGSAHALFRQFIINHNARMPAEKQFTIGNITVEDQTVHILGKNDNIADYDYKQIAINSIVDNWNTTFDQIETCLLSYIGGYLMTRREGNVTYLDWAKDYTSTATQEIEFGENLLDLTDETTAEDLFTVLIPIGDDNITVASVNGGSDEVVDEAAVAKYGRIIKTNVFGNVTNKNTLLENARRYLQNNVDVPRTLTLTAVDLHNVHPEIESIKLGDRVYIRSEPHTLDQYLTCTKIEYDLEHPENTSYTFGREKQSLTQRYKEDKRISNDTYGNDASIGGSSYYGGVGGAIGSAAIEEAKEETKWEVERTYNDIANKLDHKVGIKLDAEQGTTNIYSIAEDTRTHKSAIAEIETWAGRNSDGSLGSHIALNADLVKVSNRLEAIEGIFTSVTAERVTVGRTVAANSFYGNSFVVSSLGDSETDLASHRHSLILSNGHVTAGPPVPPSSAIGFDIESLKPVFGA